MGKFVLDFTDATLALGTDHAQGSPGGDYGTEEVEPGH
jgi:hypothetical protein